MADVAWIKTVREHAFFLMDGEQGSMNNVDHPAHYNKHPSGVECIQVVEHMSFNLGNAVKYIWRADEKHESPIEDLKKAAWYIQREIERLERG